MIDAIEVGVIAALACGPVALVGTIVNAVRIGKIRRTRASRVDVTRLWRAIRWFEGQRDGLSEKGEFYLTVTEGAADRLAVSIAYTERQQAAEERLMPEVQPRDTRGRFVRAGSNAPHTGANAA